VRGSPLRSVGDWHSLPSSKRRVARAFDLAGTTNPVGWPVLRVLVSSPNTSRDMNHAAQLIGQHPALTYGNIFEIRPAGDMSEIIKASEQRRRQNTAR
jgi:hypothetical protein